MPTSRPRNTRGVRLTRSRMTARGVNQRLSRRAALLGMGGVLGVAGGLGACEKNGASGAPSGARVLRVGMLRISPHLMAPRFYARFAPPGLAIETLAFNNSTEIKTAVVTGSVDFAVTGVTAALQGAARGEPFVVLAAAADGASAIVARRDHGIGSLEQLAGKRVGYVPGSAQDVLLRLSLRARGLRADEDVRLVKVGFGDMPNALERGDIEAFTGAETGPSVALLRGRSHVVLHPYDTPMGKINIVFGTRRALLESEPELCRSMVLTHARATDHLDQNRAEWARATSKAWGAKLEAVQLAIENITLRWRLDDAYVAQARVLGEQLEQLRQIKRQPEYDGFIARAFTRELAELSG
jgi:NitT/TauT family transport system substrate-binding protein